MSIDLQSFCAKEDYEKVLSEPVVKSGWKYACDGKICIRIAAPGEPDSQHDFLNIVENIFNDLTGIIGTVFALPEPAMKLGECNRCDGRGRINQYTCEKCDGSGECVCKECNAPHECGRYGGGGYIGGTRCPVCKGERTMILAEVYRFGHHWIAAKYAEMVNGLPGPIEWFAGEKPASGMRFRFDGGDGIVMSVIYKPEEAA